MKRFHLLFISSLGLALSVTSVLAEEPDIDSLEVGYNPNSLHPIPYSDILMKRRVWRHIDLREKQNKPFFPHKKRSY